ncbi:MAG: class I SAM-dependent methyltransferase [Legionella sp.]|nr:class I SAM-dependent methyltransferase [Legionella sp.]
MKKKIVPEMDAVAEFDLYRHTYSEQINESLAFLGQEHGFYTKVKANYLSTILDNEQSNIVGKIKVLDVGCGHGLIHHHLLTNNKENLDLFGVDIASSVIEMAQLNNPTVNYQSYDGLKLPFPGNTFDIAFAICVMHHVPPLQWLDFLEEMKRVVKNNGIVIIFEHNPINPITARIVKKCPLDKNAVLLRSKHMFELMQKVGLVDMSTKFILFTPIDNLFFHKLDRKLNWLPLGAQYYTLARKTKA